MNAFIVRPFGIKSDIDFDKVDKELIQPALNQVGILGSTTAAIIEQGNIREDMFAQLLLADLVIADLSIHNANVFYELGIRHALRDKRTFLIRCSKDEIPFDLKTDRYLSYPAENPSEAVNALVSGLKATLLSEKGDSPVFFMLPKLEAQDPERFLAVPSDFGEEVELARAGKQIGKLSLLASEAEGFPWEIPALRNIAEALYQSNDLGASGIYWEKVRNRNSNDVEANDRLSTIYQRRAEDELKTNHDFAWELLEKSDQAIERILSNAKLDSNKKAEMYTLQGRNAKTKWIDTWRKADETEWKKEALKSTFLFDAYEGYERGYSQDLNHFYSGINALGLLTIIISLAENLPDTWLDQFSTEKKGLDKLEELKLRHQNLAVLVQAAIDAKRNRALQNDKPDPWINMTEADLACFTYTKPSRVGALYEKIIQEAKGLTFDSAKRQLIIYKQLGVVPENVESALAAFSKAEVGKANSKPHYLLFTGHMIDKEDRPEPRFPQTKEMNAKAAIKEVVLKEKEKYNDTLQGIAGGACGGDILFHEVCAELEVKTELYLAIPREDFLVASVSFAGSQWIDRFNVIFSKGSKRILSDTKELPKWLQKKPNYSIWERNNLWMLNSSLVCGGVQMTLVALWDGKGGDGEGGTEHMVREAKSRGAKVIVIDINTI